MATRSTTSSPVSRSHSPAPRLATLRNPANPTRGGQIGQLAKVLGTPLMPWQQMVADVAGEVDPSTGHPVYREVVLLVPRQSGKTTLLLAEMVHRAFAYGRPQFTRYAAQTGDDAIAKWKEHVEILRGTAFRRLFDTDDINGQRALVWSNGSRYTPTATTKKSGHGKVLDQGIIDEAFAQIDFRTEQAMRPAMQTRRDAQLMIVSTAGDNTSVFLNAKMAANRERLELEPDAPSSTAYFEWSAGDDEDPFDEDTWWRCMPALGRTVDPAVIRADLEAMLADPLEGERGFRRAYLNQTDRGTAATHVFAGDDWKDTGSDDSWIVGPRTLALDVTPDRSWGSVAWAGLNRDGQIHFELIKHERGTQWITAFLFDKAARQKEAPTVSVVGRSQAAAMVDELRDFGLDVRVLSAADYVAACAAFHDGITRRETRHLRRGQLDLDVAVSGAAWTNSETRTWDRRKATTDISPLVACTIAQWAFVLEHREAEQDYDVLDSIA